MHFLFEFGIGARRLISKDPRNVHRSRGWGSAGLLGLSEALRASGILTGAQEERREGQFEGIHSPLSRSKVFAVGP